VIVGDVWRVREMEQRKIDTEQIKKMTQTCTRLLDKCSEGSW